MCLYVWLIVLQTVLVLIFDTIRQFLCITFGMLDPIFMRMLGGAEDPVVLRFHGSCLRKSDLKLLQKSHHLNDQIVSFYFEYLGKKIFKHQADWLFVGAQMTQRIRMAPAAEIGQYLDPLEATQKSFIFFALNDCDVADPAGDSHWSLLVFSRPEKTFFHFDSAYHRNLQVCVPLVMTLKQALNCPEASPRIGECVQQSNRYDCGIHMLCTVDMVAEQIKYTGKIEKVCAQYVNIEGKREALQNIIKDLAKLSTIE